MTSIAPPSEPSSEPPAFDPTSPLRATGNLRRRQLISRGVQGLAIAAALAAVGVLGIVTEAVIQRGGSRVSVGFVVHDAAQFGNGGGIASAILGTALIVALGAAIAFPLGLLCAIYLVEFAGSGSAPGRLLRLALDMMQGLPTVIIGLFVLGLITIPEHHDTGWAGSIALSIIMLPLIARTAQETLLTVPGALRDASDALGVDRWRSILTVILPSAASGILTGTILAVARAAGETAPLLLVDSIFQPNQTTIDLFGHGVPNLPVLIFDSVESPTSEGLATAWGASLVLLGLILIANIGARLLLARNRRRMGL